MNIRASHHRDALIRKLDERRKLAELPAKAFATLMNHIGKKLQLTNEQISLVSHIEKNNNIDMIKTVNALYRTLKHKGDLQHFPQKTRKLLQARHNQANVGEMQKYLNSIKDVSFAPDIARELSYYEDLLIKIERGSTPSEVDLANLDKLHDTLKAKGKLDAMPNRSQAFLENYRTQREIKKKLPSNTNITELFKRLRNNQEFKPMEVAYFFFYLQKNDITLPPPEQARFGNFLTKYSELAKITKQQAELLDPKALKVIEQVIKQIAEEQRAGFKKGKEIYIPSLNASISRTSNFMEIRFQREAIAKHFGSKEDINALIAGKSTQSGFFENHKGLDFTAHAKNDGKVTYQYGLGNVKFTGTGIQPKIVEVLSVVNDTSASKHIKRNAKVVTILEYHPAYGVLLTIFRHLPKAFVQVGNNLTVGHAIGTYEISYQHLTDKEKIAKDEAKRKNKEIIFKEHVHIEREYANAEVTAKYNAQQWENKLNALSDNNPKNNASITKEVTALTKTVQPVVDGNEYHAIALFTPGSALNRQFLQDAEQKWLKNTQRFIKIRELNDPKKVKALIKELNHDTYRDQLMLKTIVEMLLKIKILLAQVGERNDGLERTMQKAQKTAIDLREDFLPEAIKITL